MKWRPVLPLPGFVLHPFTALVTAIVHLYLSFGHLAKLFGGDVQWTHFWKGFGALGGAYVFVVGSPDERIFDCPSAQRPTR